MNQIKIDPERTSGSIDRNIFGGFAEHLDAASTAVFTTRILNSLMKMDCVPMFGFASPAANAVNSLPRRKFCLGLPLDGRRRTGKSAPFPF